MKRQPIKAGDRFGAWVVVTSADPDGRGQRRWRCRCACGSERIVGDRHLVAGASNGCTRCAPRGQTQRTHGHGYRRTRTYNIWTKMRRRCERATDHAFVDYGGRGIVVCDRWRDFAAFLEDMGECPSRGHSIDRVDNDGPYSPENCRWATRLEQANNTRANVRITVHGETRTLSEWARLGGFGESTVRARLRRGWSPEDAVTQSLRDGGHPLARAGAST